jgi:dihydropyrimidine dehydrogenase (NAD+) subunit PreA
MIDVINETARCLLCCNENNSAPCTYGCPNGLNPADFIRSLRFGNLGGNGFNTAACDNCNGECQKSCIHPDFPIRIKSVAKELKPSVKKDADLSVMFCGVKCGNPFFLSSSVVASNYEMCSNALKMGWGGIVYKTIGMMQLQEVSPRFDAIGKYGVPFTGFRNLEQISDKPLKQDLLTLERLKKDFPDKVIVSSIMGQDVNEWRELARLSEEAGTDIIELNFSCPHMREGHLGSAVGNNPELVKEFTEAAKSGTKLPVLAKMTPNLANIELPAIAAVDGGADGIAAINTVKCLTNILDGDTFVNGKTSVSGYSGKAVKPIALRFIHDLKKHDKLADVPLSGMGGIETWEDTAEFLALGCGNLQITTAVMQYGYRIIDDLISGLRNFLSENNMTLAPVSKKSRSLIGSALPRLVPASELDRETVVFPVIDKENCIGCGRCYVSCKDGGHQAIEFCTVTRIPKINGEKCVGCHLCKLVCPRNAIHNSKRIPVRKREAK